MLSGKCGHFVSATMFLGDDDDDSNNDNDMMTKIMFMLYCIGIK